MKISLVIPIYNTENYLKRCLDSLICQRTNVFEDQLDFEFLLVDDGSTDSVSSICKEYCEKDARFKYFYKENGGVSSARNYGLERATGEYIAFPDSDDTVTSGFYASIIEAMLTYNTDIGCGKINMIKPPEYRVPEAIISANKFSYHHGPSTTLWAEVYKTSLIKDNNIKCPPMSYYEDKFFNFSIFAFSSSPIVAYSENEYYKYYMGNANSITNRGDFVSRSIEAIPVMVDRIKSLKKSNTKNNVIPTLVSELIRNCDLLKKEFESLKNNID